MGLSYVITGTKGAISFTQERMAELKLYLHDDPVNRQGFRTLLVGPAHPDYGAFCMGAGHGIGFNDQKRWKYVTWWMALPPTHRCGRTLKRAGRSRACWTPSHSHTSKAAG